MGRKKSIGRRTVRQSKATAKPRRPHRATGKPMGRPKGFKLTKVHKARIGAGVRKAARDRRR